MNPFRFRTHPSLERAALAFALVGCLTAFAVPAAAQARGGGHVDDGLTTSHEDSDHIDPGEDHAGSTGLGRGPRWKGGGSSGERGGHEDGGHEDGENSADGHDSGDDHADGKRGPRYMGGRGTETILTGRHSVSIEDRVFRGHGN